MTVEVNDDGSIGIPNDPIEGSIRVVKRDKIADIPVEGAEFTLYDSEGKAVKKVTTDKEGIAISVFQKRRTTKTEQGGKSESDIKSGSDSFCYEKKDHNLFRSLFCFQFFSACSCRRNTLDKNRAFPFRHC